MTDSHEIERLQAEGVLQEPTFRSRLPLIGPFIAWFRAAWNSVSTKWYVRPLIAQQNEFNALVAGQIGSIAEQLHSQEIRLGEIERRLGEIERRVGEIEHGVGAHDGRLHDLGAWLIAQDREQSEAIHDLAEIRVQLGQIRKRLAPMSVSAPRRDADNGADR